MIKQDIDHFFLSLFYPRNLSNSLWESDVSLFSALINKVSILFYIFIEFITLLYIFFFVISFSPCKEYKICLISFSKFSDVLPAFNCTSAMGNFWSICSGINIIPCLVCRTPFTYLFSFKVWIFIFRNFLF